jgi:hypothetical protein
VSVENRDLQAAIDDMLARFPKTLDYLAKRTDLAAGRSGLANKSEARRAKPASLIS